MATRHLGALASLVALLVCARLTWAQRAIDLPVVVTDASLIDRAAGAKARSPAVPGSDASSSTPRIVVRAQAGLDAPARRLARQAESDLLAIEADLRGLPRVAQVEIRLVKRMRDIGAAAPGPVPAWAQGVAFPALGVVVVARFGERGAILDTDKTLAHELAHLALGRALSGGDPARSGRAPRWLTEGFAYLHSADFSLARTTTLMGAAFSRSLIPLAKLDAAFPAREDEAELAYAESYDFVAHLAARGRWADADDDGDRSAFRAFLAELGAGSSVDDSAHVAFGMPLAELEKEWLASLSKRYFWVPIVAFSSLIWVAGAVLLVLGWWRRKRGAHKTLERWAREEAADGDTLE